MSDNGGVDVLLVEDDDENGKFFSAIEHTINIEEYNKLIKEQGLNKN